MSNAESNCRQIIVASVVAALMLFVSDLTYRIVAARAASSVARIPVDPAAMRQFPLRIGDWIGLDIPLDDTMKKATGVDAHINRQYSRISGMESVGLYIASGGGARALVAHRPEVCYTASGWTLLGRRSMALPLNDGRVLPCTVFEFSRGGFETEKKTVLYYYIVDGQHRGDVSVLRSKVWYGSDRVDYAAQVQIAAGARGIHSSESVVALVSAFAVDSALPIAQLFKRHETTESTRETSQIPGEGG